MPANRSAFPKGRRRFVWETVVKKLRADAVLRRCVETWYVLDGSDLVLPPDKWSLAQLPALALTWTGRNSEWFANREFKAPLVLNLTLGIGSTCETDLWDFWESIETALFPPAEPYGLLKELSGYIHGQTITGPGVAPSYICSSKGLSSDGQVMFNFHRQT